MRTAVPTQTHSKYIGNSMNISPETCLFPMQNVIQNYAWGSTTAIESLFEIENKNREPQAEIWMGAHLNGCSQIDVAGTPTPISDFIESDKKAILGEATAEHFSELPYLFKVLAAEKALSIQVHPSKQQAEAGFANEQATNVPLNATHRNFKDPNHKPELVYALTPYQAMNGFRSFEQILTYFHAMDIPALASLTDAFQHEQNEQGLGVFFEAMLSLQDQQKKDAIIALLNYAQAHKQEQVFALISALNEQYPGDIGLFSPLMLNVVTLNPGQAMFLHAGTPHAYIKGTGLEIMANSDNVLRAGLTPKHIDIKELVSCVVFKPMDLNTLLITPSEEAGSQHFPIPVADFKFNIYRNQLDLGVTTNSAEILLAIDAPLHVSHQNGETVTLKKGESVFIPHYASKYQLSSQGLVARAYN